jgi:NAD(P)-dependent dehydrogenase (short-subunit alcohol dehydrogenase family)
MGRVVVVSGAGTGIGRAITRIFAGDGDTVYAIGRRSEVLADTVAAINLEVRSELVRPIVADLREPAAAAQVAADVSGREQTVDVVVNNAGGNYAPAAARCLEDIRAQWRLNVDGNVLPAVLLTHALLPYLRRPGGRIVTITSIAAFRGPATYGGAKAALHAWSADLATTLAEEGIAVNSVAPGYVTDTEFYGARMTPALHADRSQRAPLRRAGSPQEIATLVHYLASAGAGFVVGQIVQANGGALLGRG